MGLPGTSRTVGAGSSRGPSEGPEMKDSVRSAVVAILATVAVALAAATLDTTTSFETAGSSGIAGGDGGGGNPGGLIPPPTNLTAGGSFQIPFLTELSTALAVLAIIISIAYILLFWRQAIGFVAVSVLLVGLVIIVLNFLTTSSLAPSLPALDPGSGFWGGGSGGGTESTSPQPPLLLALLALGLVIGSVAVILARRGIEPAETDSGAEVVEASDRDAAAVGRAAGRAADRIEAETDTKNEVYRAWQEMTDLLDVAAPETSTPGEFAEAAVDAGLGREDVDALTRLFEDVRYGDLEPSTDRERSAVAIFRRIEARYAEAKETDDA